MSLWLVTAVGVYDHGVQFIGVDEEQARAFIDTYTIDADGYHSWRIEEWPDPPAIRPHAVFHTPDEVKAEWDRRQQQRVGLGYGDPKPWPGIEVEVCRKEDRQAWL